MSSKNLHPAFLVRRIAAAGLAHDEALAFLDVDADLLAVLHAVEEHRGGQQRDVAEAGVVRGVVLEHFRVHQPRGEIGVGDLAADGGSHFGARGLEVDGGQEIPQRSLDPLA